MNQMNHHISKNQNKDFFVYLFHEYVATNIVGSNTIYNL